MDCSEVDGGWRGWGWKKEVGEVDKELDSGSGCGDDGEVSGKDVDDEEVDSEVDGEDGEERE